MITKIICAVGLALLSILALAVLWEKNHTEQRVAMPKFLLILAAATVIGAGWLFNLYWTEGDRELLGACIAAAVGAVLMTLAYFNLQIDYDETGFTARKYFGRPKHYTYDEILGVDMGVGNYTLVMRSGKVKVDMLATGKIAFYEYAEEKFTANSRHGHFPEIESPSFSKKILRNNVKNPGEFIFMSIAWCALIVYLEHDLFRECIEENHLENISFLEVFLDSSRYTLGSRIIMGLYMFAFIVFAAIPIVIRYADKVPFLANLCVKPDYRNYDDGRDCKQPKRKRKKRSKKR